MPFRYSCFISYRHGQQKLAERIISDLSAALANELDLLVNKELFVDRERLKGGTFYNEALATALCQSVCMIVVFTPTYFDKEYPFCAREYKAMERLEESRLKRLEESNFKGLIIPIVFRGKNLLPSFLSDRRQYYDFSEFLLSDVEMSRHPYYAAKIKEIAQVVHDRHDALTGLTEDPCGNCFDFHLPPEEEIRSWLETVVRSVAPFPGRQKRR